MFVETEYYDWNALIDNDQRNRMITDIKQSVDEGKYWDNSPPFQANFNVFGLPGDHWNNMKMSFIWSCFAYLKRDAQIKTIKAWSYMTSLKYPYEDRNLYWHNHERPGSVVLSGVFYLHIPKGVNTLTAGTEFSPMGPENDQGRFFAEAKQGHWVIWPGKAWHRPGILQSQEDRFIIAADMEL